MKAEANIPVYMADVQSLPASGFRIGLSPGDKELSALATLAGVSQIGNLAVELMLRRWRRDGVQVEGKITGEIEQPCRLTLEPVIQHLDEEFQVRLVSENSRLARIDADSDGELILDPEGDDLPDTFTGNRIDLWPIIIEQLILLIDPFPQVPGAVLENIESDSEEPADAKTSPFSVLSKLKQEE
ncbi:MAG: YceD family protein [Rhizobiaceae bacterium]